MLWYNDLTKPPFTPPSGYFMPAWIILYTLMGIALFIVLFSKSSKSRTSALILFFIQLVFNLLWSYLFFGMMNMELALFDVILLFIILIPAIVYFFKVSKIAGWLMIPYLLQVAFALYLNSGFLLLN